MNKFPGVSNSQPSYITHGDINMYKVELPSLVNCKLQSHSQMWTLFSSSFTNPGKEAEVVICYLKPHSTDITSPQELIVLTLVPQTFFFFLSRQ